MSEQHYYNPEVRGSNALAHDAIAQLITDYDRLRELYFEAIRAGDDMAEACSELVSQACAHRIPAYPVVDRATQTIKSWRSAR